MTDYILAQTSTQIQSAITRVTAVPGVNIGSEYYIDVRKHGATANGTTDDTVAIQAALTAAAQINGTVFFPAGTYLYSNSSTVGENTTLIFNNCLFKANASYPVFSVTGSNVSFLGSAIYDGNGLQAGFVMIAATHFLCDMNLSVQNIVPTYGKAAFMCYQASGVSIKGNITTTDSILVNSNGTSNLSIEGVNCTYTSSLPYPPLYIYDNQSGHSYNNVKLHNIVIDGGGALAVSAITIEGWNPQYPTYHVTLDSLILTNTLGGGDGIDLMWTYYNTVDNVICDSVNVGVVVCSSATVLNNVIGANCRAGAIGIGDPVYTHSIDNVELNNCQAFNCGIDGTGVASNGISMYSYPGETTSHVRINNCQSITWGNQLYGLGIAADCQYVDVVNSTFSGSSGAYSNSATAGMVVFKNNRGINPIGYLGSQPSVSASTVAYTNNFGVSCRVFVAGGTVTAIAIGSTATGMTSGQFIVEPGETIKLTYSSAPTWKWFGM